jgi:hypothetical protein
MVRAETSTESWGRLWYASATVAMARLRGAQGQVCVHLCVDDCLVVGGKLCIGLVVRPVLPLYGYGYRWWVHDCGCCDLATKGEHLAVRGHLNCRTGEHEQHTHVSHLWGCRGLAGMSICSNKC